MEKIILIIGSILIQIGLCFLWYTLGYSKREDEFQKNPISFNVGNQAAMYVENINGILKVRIYNEKLIEIVKYEKGIINL